MSETKAFPTEDVLSAITGYLISERMIGAVYDVMNFMTGESLMTHQLPRVCMEAREVMRTRISNFARIEAEAKEVNGENWRRWAAIWIDRLGPTIDVPKMTPADHERIDPLSELAEKIHPDKIVVVSF